MQDLATQDYAAHQIKQLNITEHAIQELNQRYGELIIKDFNDAEGYKSVKAARSHVKELRVSLEKKRKELVENPMRIKQQIDNEAKRRREQLEALENKLEVQEKAYDAEKDRIKQERAAKEEQDYQDRIAKLAAFSVKWNGQHFVDTETDGKNILLTAIVLRGILEDAFNEILIKATNLYDHNKAEQEQKARAQASAEAIVKEEREEAIRLLRKELDRKQAAIDAERARLKQEREEQQAELERLQEQNKELLRQKFDSRIHSMESIGFVYNKEYHMFDADFLEGSLLNAMSIQKATDAEFDTILVNYHEARKNWLQKQENIKEAAQSNNEIGEIIIDEEPEGGFHFDEEPSREVLALVYQSAIKESCGKMLELYSIPISGLQVNVSDTKWNIEHDGYRLFSCNIGEYLKDKT